MFDHELTFIIEIDFKIQSFLEKDFISWVIPIFFNWLKKTDMIAWCFKDQGLSLSGSSGVSNSKLRSSISTLGISLFKMVSGTH